MKLKAILVSLALLMSGGVAHAIPVQTDFTANFSTGPIPTLTGSFFYDAASLTADIQTLTGIDLNINGHVYTLGEVGFQNYGGGFSLIGGTVSGLNTIIGTSVSDFFFVFGHSPQSFSVFAFATPGVSQHMISSLGSVSIHSPTKVPEPATLALFGMGLLGVIAVRRRKSI